MAGAPNQREDLFARQDAALRLDQAPQHVEFGGGQLDGGTGTTDQPRARVDGELSGLHDGFDPLAAQPVSPQHGFDARQELGQPERLGDVVFGAELEAHDLIHLGAARAEHDHGHDDLLGAQLAYDLEAVHLRQHHVEDDEVDSAGRGERQPFFAVGRDLHVVAFGLQVHAQPERDALVVFDDQDVLASIYLSQHSPI